MKPSDERMWLDGGRTVDHSELARLCGIAEADIDELVEYGSLPAPQRRRFPADVVTPLREAMRLRSLFDLDLFTAGLLVQYLRRIEHLESQLKRVQSPQPHHAAHRDGPAPWNEPHGLTGGI